MFEEIQSLSTFRLPPAEGRTAAAWSSIGYELYQAIADIIDNSIEANASQIVITFFRDDKQLQALAISDDGIGMDREGVKLAMQFQGGKSHSQQDLGVFGTGLKAASLSQCKCLTVVSQQEGIYSACRWNKEAIDTDWACEELDGGSSAKAFEKAFGSSHAAKSGTTIIWTRLQRLNVSSDNLDAFVDSQIDALRLRLGLIFHRFIERGLKITIRSKNVVENLSAAVVVTSLNPFPYKKSGSSEYPKTFKTTVAEFEEIELEAHIWPPDTLAPEFFLGKTRATTWQGFYFYRNDRLIEPGGWHGLVKDTSDAELSLARVKVELNGVIKTSINLQKTAVQMPAAFTQELQRARCGKLTLEDYLDEAREIYRSARAKKKRNRNLPTYPGAGIPADASRAIKALTSRKENLRSIDFFWTKLKRKSIFELDLDGDRILLNSIYRRRIVGESRLTGVDAAFSKTLLFLLLRTEFDRERFSAERKKWLSDCNAYLLEIVKRL